MLTRYAVWELTAQNCFYYRMVESNEFYANPPTFYPVPEGYREANLIICVCLDAIISVITGLDASGPLPPNPCGCPVCKPHPCLLQVRALCLQSGNTPLSFPNPFAGQESRHGLPAL